jgi:MFS family permease
MFFFWGVSSSMIFSILPVYIVDSLGRSSKEFGLLEGTVLFLSFVSKVLIGLLVDIFKKSKKILAIGSGITVLSRLSFVFVNSMFGVFLAKSLDRFAKGFRSAPSDAILAHTSTNYRFAYSFKHMSNVLGILFGSLVTYLLISYYGQNFKLIFSISVFPAIVSFLILMSFTKKKGIVEPDKKKTKFDIKIVKELSKSYWQAVIFASILMFSRFSEGFITLRAKEVLPNMIHAFPMFMTFYEVCTVVFALIVGRMSEKVEKRNLMLIGVVTLLLTNVNAVYASGIYSIVMIYIGAGIHMGITHGLLYSIIAQNASKEIIGTAFAIYYGAEGICLFCSNYLAGCSSEIVKSMDFQGSSGPFFLGIISTFVSCVYLIFGMKKQNSPNPDQSFD